MFVLKSTYNNLLQICEEQQKQLEKFTKRQKCEVRTAQSIDELEREYQRDLHSFQSDLIALQKGINDKFNQLSEELEKMTKENRVVKTIVVPGKEPVHVTS